MTGRYDGSKGAATHLLQHYFRLTAQCAGVQWDSDNDVEIEAIVDGIITAAVHQVTGTVLKSAMCPACGLRVAGASGLCAECEREAVRLSHAAQASTQEAQPARPKRDPDAYSVPLPDEYTAPAPLKCDMCLSTVAPSSAVQYEDGYFCPACASKALRRDSIAIFNLQEQIAQLRHSVKVAKNATQPQHVAWVHVPPVADSLSECPSCLTEIGVLFWQDGKSLVQECPACGVFLDVYKNDDGLHVHAVGLERPSEAESGGTLEEARRELPVPVSAIAYLMADIAPVDAQDAAKQHEARATVTAWLESLEAEED